MPRRGESAYERPDIFWSMVDVGGPDECWPWKGSYHTNGYGYIRTGPGHRTTVHRHALRLSGVDIGDGQYACHTCDNHQCCNPAHLYAGTPADNMRDKVEHGNHWYRGEAQYCAKLNVSKVAEIRAESARGVSQSVLAQRFGVGQSTISSVVLRKTWR